MRIYIMEEKKTNNCDGSDLDAAGCTLVGSDLDAVRDSRWFGGGHQPPADGGLDSEPEDGRMLGCVVVAVLSVA